MEKPREAKLDEFNELMSFLARAYNYKKNFFPRYYGHIYQKKPEKIKNSFIIKDKGRIVSHVGLFPLDVLVGRSVFKVGGIGGVATDPDYRGRGLMEKLLEFAIDRMEKEGYAFSVLWGDRQRYGNFGWELGGRRLSCTVTKRSLEWKGFEAGKIREYNGRPDDLEKIIALHERERFKVKRFGELYQLRMKKPGNQVWLGREAYLILSGKDKMRLAIESGGNPSAILSLALTLIKEKGLEGIRLSRPYECSGINRAILDAASKWTVETLCSIKIINFFGTLEGFKKEIRKDKVEKQKWPKNKKQLVERMNLPHDNLFNFYIWGLDHV
jgi:GNAT superfamily N-acetyltransferase